MQNILVIQTAFIGDAILTLPLIQEISARNPDAKIDVITIPKNEKIFSASPFISEVHMYDKSGEDKSLLSTFNFARKLRKNKYDLIISPHRSFRTALLTFFIKPKHSIGFDISSFSFIYTTKVKYRKDVHEVARNLSLLDESYLNEDKWKIKPEIDFKDVNTELVDNLLKNIEKEIIAIAPGSVWETKKYPPEYFSVIAQKIAERNYQVIFLGGEADTELCEQIMGNNKQNKFNFAGKLDILSSVYLLTKAKLLISNDSAPTHMAMAAGIPAITLYTSTIPGFGFYPYLNGSKILSYDELRCKPCGIHGHSKCPVKTFDCGFKLTPDFVSKEIEQYLKS